MAAADTNKKGWPGTLCGKPARLSDTVDELYGKGIITARLRFMLGNLADIGTLRDILTDTRTEKRLWKDFGFSADP